MKNKIASAKVQEKGRDYALWNDLSISVYMYGYTLVIVYVPSVNYNRSFEQGYKKRRYVNVLAMLYSSKPRPRDSPPVTAAPRYCFAVKKDDFSDNRARIGQG
jgi:hypothetical protein